jgi:hypothetical protein
MLSAVRSPPFAKTSVAFGNFSRAFLRPSQAESSLSSNAIISFTPLMFLQITLRVWKSMKLLPFLRLNHASEFRSTMTPSDSL